MYPIINLTQEIIDEAITLAQLLKMNRTIASNIDTVTGILGEFVFAEYFYGDWKTNKVGKNIGQEDFKYIEIKTSTFPFRDSLNLLVREDYARKRKPPFYIQIILDLHTNNIKEFIPGVKAYISGWATSKDVINSPLKDFGSKFGSKSGYKCHFIQISNLNKMSTFKLAYEALNN